MIFWLWLAKTVALILGSLVMVLFVIATAMTYYVDKRARRRAIRERYMRK